MSGLIEKVGLLTQMAVDKGREAVDTTKLRLDIKTEEKTIKACLLIIGEYVASHEVLRDNEIILEQLQKIKESNDKIEALNAKIKELHNQK